MPEILLLFLEFIWEHFGEKCFQKASPFIDDVIILEHWCREILAVKERQYFVCYYVVLVLG